MFRGHYEKKVDAKGRVSIPAKFREVISEKHDENVMVTTLKNSLVAYPMDEWMRLEEKMLDLPEFSPEVNSFQFVFLSGAVECSIDKQGRILLPPLLRKYAKLEKEVVFVGLLRRFQIWSKEIWEGEFEKARAEFDKNSSNLDKFGFK